mmetsp:Transcript_16960/g.14857  ORF Transcript_16960/g.14857 Transcript_16960/m.14857 type:complete len:151 (+) Transcript_16960:84-536(+)
MDKEIFYQISLNELNHQIDCVLFAEPFYSQFDVEFNDKQFQNIHIRELINDFKDKIQQEVNSIYNRILFMYFIQKKCIQSKTSNRERKIDRRTLELNQKYYHLKESFIDKVDDDPKENQVIMHWNGVLKSYKDFHPDSHISSTIPLENLL